MVRKLTLTQWGLDTDKLIDALGPIIKSAASEAIVMAVEDKASLWIEVKAEDATDFPTSCSWPSFRGMRRHQCLLVNTIP